MSDNDSSGIDPISFLRLRDDIDLILPKGLDELFESAVTGCERLGSSVMR
jgi:hypothetical protein